MKFRAQVDDWIDEKAEQGIRDYFRQIGPGPYEFNIFPANEFISERLRRYMFGIIRLILNHHVNELGNNELTIRDILHEIEDELNPQYEVLIYTDGTPIKKWYSREALNIKDKLQGIYGPRGLYLPDPGEGYETD